MSNKPIQIRIDDKLRDESFSVFNQMNIKPNEAIRGFLRYVANNKRLPFKEVNLFIDEDEDILRIAEDRLRNPGKTIEVNVDDL
ncbi:MULTISPECIES: type II toxin-antitoxin system RelB/DinJ family antitoxin [unclassified Gilliamella]|uniref:type II toxin-antitoxin system RelB/DinJ family antitoxin n=1 Tax=unclassified Gilliamella TaxID=2685620 RepID=UPI00135E07AC|nr:MULTISPECIES: type II toxin-antitoxin system RelB/DinJ family antitoxin [unclassified Gilliamella]MWP63304.1 type II toxin-antitoxin system RelB/DinJ family antitoxin [Gilliamella sp. Pas-s25]NUF49589.1 type II toxin-antitoxin system RelB/DinJ family antitoxin [Gilliamella sp. ESL0250]